MKSQLLLSLFVFTTLILSACGGDAPATPTISSVDVQNTAIAAAFTVVAQTHAALPTDTPAPTDTPIPPTGTPTQTPLTTETSATPLDTPTVAPLAASPTTAVGGSDPCNAPLQKVSGGTPAKIRISNESGAAVTVSLYLNKTPFGDCGYRGYNIARGNSVTITDLVLGCYNVSVFVNDPKKPSKAFGYGCINNSDRWTFFVYKDKVVLSGM